MADITLWPSVFPAPRLGIQFATAQNRQLGSGDVAPQVAVFDANYRETLSASFVMDCTQFELFRSWYRWRLFNGCGCFQVSWGKRPGTARFTDGWSASRTDADRYELTASVEIDYSAS